MFDRELACDGKTQAAAAGFAAACPFKAVKRPEDRLDLIGGNARSTVANLNRYGLVSAVEIDIDRRVATVMGRILQKVRQPAFQRHRVSVVDARWIVPMQPQLGAFTFQIRRLRLDGFPQIQLYL